MTQDEHKGSSALLIQVPRCSSRHPAPSSFAFRLVSLSSPYKHIRNLEVPLREARLQTECLASSTGTSRDRSTALAVSPSRTTSWQRSEKYAAQSAPCGRKLPPLTDLLRAAQYVGTTLFMLFALGATKYDKRHFPSLPGHLELTLDMQHRQPSHHFSHQQHD